MPLNKSYLRDFNHQIIGNVTNGFDNGHVAIVRNTDGRVLGRTTTRFNETRDNTGRIVSNNTADAGLLIRNK